MFFVLYNQFIKNYKLVTMNDVSDVVDTRY